MKILDPFNDNERVIAFVPDLSSTLTEAARRYDVEFYSVFAGVCDREQFRGKPAIWESAPLQGTDRPISPGIDSYSFFFFLTVHILLPRKIRFGANVRTDET